MMNPGSGSEADWLNEDWGDLVEYEFREKDAEAYYQDIAEMQSRYRDNQNSPVGATVRCACCNKRIIKKSYQTQFCSNKGKGNCKDTFWNNTVDKRRMRAQQFNR